MQNDLKRQNRCSIRLKDYDYSQPGSYFVTLCTKDRECIFGSIIDGNMIYNKSGIIVHDFWNLVSRHFPNIDINAYTVMPNHVHVIIIINVKHCRGGVTPPLQQPTLGKIVAYYKYQTAKLINETTNTPGRPVWQRNYYEHVIRADGSFEQICNYIQNNPINWLFDRENPEKQLYINEFNSIEQEDSWRI